MIGPAIPNSGSSSSPPVGLSIGPQIPQHLQFQPDPAGEDDDEDDYVPALPPDLIAQRTSTKRVLGPTLPSMTPRDEADEDEDDEDDDVGPKPLPSAYLNSLQEEEKDGVTEFLEREQRRKKAIEEASKPKALQREEWMLVPPSASDLLGSIDPTRLNKGRKFAPTTTSNSRNPDNSLWTETPAERQQRLADELSGKKKRKENSEGTGDDDGRSELEVRKRRRRDEEIQRAVSEHTRQNRPESLLNMHSHTQSAVEAQEKDRKEDEGIWDHSRDMALSGRLMDDKTRNKFITEARGLGDRFGSSKFA